MLPCCYSGNEDEEMLSLYPTRGMFVCVQCNSESQLTEGSGGLRSSSGGISRGKCLQERHSINNIARTKRKRTDPSQVQEGIWATYVFCCDPRCCPNFHTIYTIKVEKHEKRRRFWFFLLLSSLGRTLLHIDYVEAKSQSYSQVNH